MDEIKSILDYNDYDQTLTTEEIENLMIELTRYEVSIED